MAFIRNTKPAFASPITVGKKWDKDAIYIGRGSPLGNPYAMKNMTQEERERVCDAYIIWFDAKVKAEDPTVINELRRIYALAKQGPITLGCFCKQPDKEVRCHGDTIKAFLDHRLFLAHHSNK